MDVVQTLLMLFTPPPTDNSIVKEYWVDYNPIAAISEGGAQAQAAMFFKDQAGHLDELEYIGSNSGYTERGKPTKDGDAGNMEGCLYLDICQGENRAILNGVSVNCKLFQPLNDFS